MFDLLVLQFAANPEAAAKRKQQRSVVKKESRKRKNAMFAYVSCFRTHALSEMFVLGMGKVDSNGVRVAEMGRKDVKGTSSVGYMRIKVEYSTANNVRCYRYQEVSIGASPRVMLLG